MADQDVDETERWLQTLQVLAKRSTHEIRNALNGVSVNLEVVRSRLERGEEKGDLTARTVAPFARSASDQLAQLAALTEAMLMLARPASRSPTELDPVVRSAVRLVDAIARSEGHCVLLSDGAIELATSLSGELVRWIVVQMLLDGLADGQALTVGLEEGPHFFVRTMSGTALPAPAGALVEAAAAAGVRVTQQSGGWSAGFPAADA